MDYRIQGKILPRILDMEENLQKLTELESKVTTALTLDQGSLHTKLHNNLTAEIDAHLVQTIAEMKDLFYGLKQLKENLQKQPRQRDGAPAN